MRTRIERALERQGLLTEREILREVLPDAAPGRWWTHPRAKELYRALVALADRPDVLLCKLVEGKSTYVHAPLWPALARVQAEGSCWPALSPEAKALLRKVERAGSLEATGKPRLELERALKVVGRSEHTERGHHRVVLVPFARWLAPDVARQAEQLSLEEASLQLAQAGFTVAPAPPPGKPRRKRPVPKR